MAPSTQGASAPAPTLDPILPRVVQFAPYHDVRVEADEYGLPRVVARVKLRCTPTARKMADLPFVGQPGTWNRACWWFFPKAANDHEAQERGRYFWDAFVTFARGTRHRRADDAQRLLGYILGDMPAYPDGHVEAHTFRDCIARALIAHLRVGIPDAPAPGRRAQKATDAQVSA